ncbi:MAG: hypothetical protein ABSB24_11065 [Gaiellaceae bacterium]|jgi:hypothetical protein
MRRQPISILAVVILSGLVVGLAGCGGGKKAASTETTTAAKASTSTTSAKPGLSGLASAANCTQLADLSASFSQALAGTGGKHLEKTAALLKQFADRTPKDIRPDFQVVAAAYAKIAGALKGVDLTSGATPSAEVLAKLTKLSSQLDQKALTKAYANISAWAQKNCTTK